MKFKALKHPPLACWEVTPECNHNCVHCYNYWRKDEEIKAELKESAHQASFDAIADGIIKQKPVGICITGGEPLMVWSHIKPCIERFVKEKISVSINTNAAMMTEEVALFAKENRIPMFVSFPCADPDIFDEIVGCKGAFGRTMRGIEIIKKAGVRFSCNMVVSTRNIDYVYDTAKFLKDSFGCDRIVMTRVGKPVNASKEFDGYLLNRKEIRHLIDEKMRIAKELGMSVSSSMPYAVCIFNSQEEFSTCGEEIGCGAGKTCYIVASDGNVKACTRDTKIYGNILTDEFEDIWAAMEEWRDESLVPKECKECKAYKARVCTSGCRTDQLSMTGKCTEFDCSTNLENINPDYTRKKRTVGEVNPEDLFAVTDELNVIEESEGFRLYKTNHRNYVFLTKAAYEFLMGNPIFNSFRLEENMGVKNEDAIRIIQHLLVNGIIDQYETI